MKRIVSLIVSVSVVIGLLTASSCTLGKKEEGAVNSKKISIVTTIFPEYDWVREIIGQNSEKFDVTMLLENGVDLHSYQPSVEDIVKISNCDMFIYVGGESDEWVNDARKTANKKDTTVINLLEVLGGSVKEEEIKEGMQEQEEHEEQEPEYDEHVWLSLKNASLIVNEIAERICDLDSDNEKTYRDNANAYISKLDALDKSFSEKSDSFKTKTVLFGDRFPFRYLVDDYLLDYYAAFAGCSAETEASFRTVTFLANKMDELSLKNIFIIEGNDGKMARTIISNTASKDANIITLDSMQSTTLGDVEAGTTYISVMENNLAALEKALA